MRIRNLLPGILALLVGAASGSAQAPESPAEPTVAPDQSLDDAPPEVEADDDGATAPPPTEEAVVEESDDVEAERGPELSADGLADLLGQSVVTTASRSAELASAAPALVYTIRADELRTYGIRTVAEALSLLSVGIFVQDTGQDYLSRADFGAQGLLLRDRGRHMLVLLDGHVMNSQASGDIGLGAELGVPIDAIDHIEVMLGPGSVSYGSNAMTAVIHIVTRRGDQARGLSSIAELSLSPPVDADADLVLPSRTRQVGTRQRMGVSLRNVIERGGTQVGDYAVHLEWMSEQSGTYELRDQQDPYFYERNPGSPSRAGAYSHLERAPSFTATVRYRGLRVSVQANRNYRTLPWVGVPREPSSHETTGTMRVEASYDADLGTRATLRSRLYGDYVRATTDTRWQHEFWCLPGMVDGCRFGIRGASLSAGIEEQLSIDWTHDGRYLTQVGGDLRVRDASGRPAEYHDIITGSPGWGAPSAYYARTSVLGALFLQQVVRPVDWLSLNVGARFDADSLFGVRVSPRAAVAVMPTDRATIRFGYTEAFRAPSASELFTWDPTYILRPESLDPEIVRALDLEYRQRFTMGQLSLRGFAAFYEDFATYRSVTPEEFDASVAAGRVVSSAVPDFMTVLDNIDRIRSYGATAFVQLRPLEGFELAASVTGSVTEVRSGADLPILPSVYGNMRGSYRLGDNGPTFAVVLALSTRRATWASPEAVSPLRPTWQAGPAAEIRAIVSGGLGDSTGFGYRVAVHYNFSPLAPYASGFGPTPDAPNDTFALTPLARAFFLVAIEHRLELGSAQ